MSETAGVESGSGSQPQRFVDRQTVFPGGRIPGDPGWPVLWRSPDRPSACREPVRGTRSGSPGPFRHRGFRPSARRDHRGPDSWGRARRTRRARGGDQVSQKASVILLAGSEGRRVTVGGACVGRSHDRSDRASVDGVVAEQFLDTQQLVVFADAVGAAGRSSLDLPRGPVPRPRAAIVVSSVSPDRWLITAVKPFLPASRTASIVSVRSRSGSP
ncbi:MAG: hypothetical protein Ct9H300mP1_10400 [Planctomycetaceae bacterium]|nr:MAG: hypothetical protein Ct9H300mP1_10400 [Planctomycetaceae bacterium]